MIREVSFASLIILIGVLLAYLCDVAIGMQDVGIILIVSILIIAMYTHMAITIFSSVLLFLIYNYIFLLPHYSFSISSVKDMIAVVAFLIVALLVGHLVSLLKYQHLKLEQERIISETEKLRSALLSSISHDLRTPLAAMIGSAETLEHYSHKMSIDDQHHLLRMIREEGERLDRYIQNLLDMTRLGQQGFSLLRSWVAIEELISSATYRLKFYMSDIDCNITIPDKLSNIYVHPALIEQALFNILENAIQHSPDNKSIDIVVSQINPTHICIDISDQGEGIALLDYERIFDMFYTFSEGDRKTKSNIGLGLTIVKAIVTAHQGIVEAGVGLRFRGTNIRMILPINIAEE